MGLRSRAGRTGPRISLLRSMRWVSFLSFTSLNRADRTRSQVTFFVQDYPNAVQRSNLLDSRILGDASAVSTHYADLVSLAARQTMAGVEITVGNNGGTDSFDLSDVKMFMKDTGGTASEYV